jgi:hypothetical protein
MIAVSWRQPAILEGELPGDTPETRVRDWLPGHCGLPYIPMFGAGSPELVLRAGFGLLATAAVAGS